MHRIQKILLSTLTLSAMALAQAPAGGAGAPGGGRGRGPAGPPRPVFTVTSSAWSDGGEVPLKYSFYGENKSPAFEFHWMLGTTPAEAPDTVKTYAVIFHDIENSTNKTAVDTLHWSAFNIPGTAKGIAEGLAAGDLPDGTRNGPGIAAGRGAPVFFGPGAGPGPFHHYVFEFYALDTKLDNPANTTRDDLVKAMEGHVVGKAAYVGRFHRQAQ